MVVLLSSSGVTLPLLEFFQKEGNYLSCFQDALDATCVRMRILLAVAVPPCEFVSQVFGMFLSSGFASEQFQPSGCCLLPYMPIGAWAFRGRMASTLRSHSWQASVLLRRCAASSRRAA